jgi:serine/threonine protein kinase
MQNFVGQTLLDRYRVDDFLGRGGMAEVYKVWDQHRASDLAMKMLHEDLAMDKIFLRRFRREAKNLSRLQHPYIVRFYGLEQDGLKAFMLMDYVEGISLKQEIFTSGPEGLPLDQVRNVAKSLTSALTFAHSEGLIHCDLKPGNVMIKPDGTVLLADFGIARLTDAATATMVGAGTPAYMAPEQIKGLNPVPQTDIYALGILLFEMLTGGERPFTGERATTTGTISARVRWEQVNMDPPSPREFTPEISPGLEKVVLTCLAKDPDDRYQTPLEVSNALELSLGDAKDQEIKYEVSPEPIQEGREGPIAQKTEHLGQERERNQVPVWKRKGVQLGAAASVLVVLLSLLVWSPISAFADFLGGRGPTAVVMSSKGEIEHQTSVGWIHRNRNIKSGDQVSFRSGSVVQIKEGETRIQLPGNFILQSSEVGEEETAVEFSRSMEDPDEVELTLLDGEVVIDGENTDHDTTMMVRAELGRAVITGTVMGVRYDPEKPLFEVDCYSGGCRIETELGQREIKGGQQASVNSQGEIFTDGELTSSEFTALDEPLITPTSSPVATNLATSSPTAVNLSTDTPVPTQESTLTPTMLPSPTSDDIDGDGIPNDEDACPELFNDSVGNPCNYDEDGDGTIDSEDKCYRDPHKVKPGACGCGNSDRDSDGDGTADCNDTCPEDASDSCHDTPTPVPSDTPLPTIVSSPTPVPSDTPLPTIVSSPTPVPSDTPLPTIVPSPTVNSAKQKCEAGGGTWATCLGCGLDKCDANPGVFCTTVCRTGCDCGSNKCWNGSKCVSNP